MSYTHAHNSYLNILRVWLRWKAVGLVPCDIIVCYRLESRLIIGRTQKYKHVINDMNRDDWKMSNETHLVFAGETE